MEEFTFRLHHAFKRTETLKVCFAHIGNEAAIGIYNFAQVGNFSRVVGSRFNHSNLVFLREAQQCFGYTNMVVEVTFGEEHVVALCKNGSGEFLGSRLTVRTRNLHDGQSQLLAMMVRQFLQHQQHIAHIYHAPVRTCHLRIVHNGVCAPFCQGVVRE